MGGNITLKKDGFEVKPNKIDLREFNRETIAITIYRLLQFLNKEFIRIYKEEPLWDFDIHKSTEIFSGSTKSFMNLSNINNNIYVTIKPILGDIDVLVNKTKATKFIEMFDKLNYFKEIDMDFIGYKMGAGEINSIYQMFIDDKLINLQIDFEFVDFISINDRPTLFAQFSRSSNWKDLKLGITGTFHKILIGSIDAAIPISVCVLKDRQTVLTRYYKHANVFSYYGIRQRYKPAIDKDGNRIFIGNEPVYELTSSKPTEKYEKDLSTIFQMLFAKNIKEDDFEKMWSFIGLIELCNLYLFDNERNNVTKAFTENLFGGRARKLYIKSDLEDFNKKFAAYNYMLNNLNQNYIDFNRSLEIINKYYKN